MGEETVDEGGYRNMGFREGGKVAWGKRSVGGGVFGIGKNSQKYFFVSKIWQNASRQNPPMKKENK